MNKLMEQLSPQDFERPMDERVFAEWKQSMRNHAGAGKVTMILFFVGLALLLLLGGMVGVIAFFVLAIIGIVQAAPKKKIVAQYQQQLGITDAELKTVLSQVKGRQAV
ncbi:hypothetical protein LJC56_06115 [Christensenellaceae bacterium OttesenSCG-928-K19]|nr:hypothetical protein [Christensenellaceae bacterium OttesenSCG-928-K19]